MFNVRFPVRALYVANHSSLESESLPFLGGVKSTQSTRDWSLQHL